jgi:vacuolar-type H+-ATPase subunit E/Vma4
MVQVPTRCIGHYQSEAEAVQQLDRFRATFHSKAEWQLRAAMNRQQLLEDVLAQALQQILACDDTQFKAVMKTILLSVTEEQAGKILPAKADKKLFSKEFIEEINTELKKNKRKLQFKVASQTSAIPRGCVIDFQDFEMNYSLENILAHLWEQVKHEVSAQLFGDGNN